MCHHSSHLHRYFFSGSSCGKLGPAMPFYDRVTELAALERRDSGSERVPPSDLLRLVGARLAQPLNSQRPPLAATTQPCHPLTYTAIRSASATAMAEYRGDCSLLPRSMSVAYDSHPSANHATIHDAACWHPHGRRPAQAQLRRPHRNASSLHTTTSHPLLDQ
jgi:hypothetical protein